MANLDEMSTSELSINTIRTLAMDAVQKAESGHPGTPMALAPLAYVLWTSFLRHNPKNPDWFDRDRFVLSNGHASMLQYAMLHLTGYDVSLEDIRNFRQWDSITPGHPENEITPGVETTTGPLGQGIMNSVGMAIAEAHLASQFNRGAYDLVNHHTYAFCSDGDLMEGASNEAASLAGHLGLGKLIWVYDDNHISIEGKTEITYSDKVAQRFEGYDWHVQDLGDKGNDVAAISQAFSNAHEETDRPSLIILRTHIAYGAPSMQDTPEAHGSPLGEEEIRETKKFYGWPEEEEFLVPTRALEHMREAVDQGSQWEREWRSKYKVYKSRYPDLAERFESYMSQELPMDWDKNIPRFEPSDGPIATRKASAKVINGFAERTPWLIGGSGDLAPSTKTLMEFSDYFEKDQYENRNIAWGVREHVMCGASSGIALHGGLRPFAATFFIFTDYARPAIRLASLMKLPVIYVMTHDSIGLGEDGPTHQPVEHLASFRAMPNMCVIRPADANEVAYGWRTAILRKATPTMLILSRQNLPIFDRHLLAGAEGLTKGAYILSKEKGFRPDILLMASGSEVQLIVEAQKQLVSEGIDARVISMPSWELFKEQPEEYQQEVIPPDIPTRLAVEAGSSFGWREWVGATGDTICIDKFGASAPYQDIFENYGLTSENVVSRAKNMTKESETIEV